MYDADKHGGNAIRMSVICDLSLPRVRVASHIKVTVGCILPMKHRMLMMKESSVIAWLDIRLRGSMI